MNTNHEEDEFVAVRVQDPRIQNEGSWNSYVDYKIFLHTNSKAFTAKTSCVRRRYSEFVWLKKKLQKNAGLVPVPDLPGKSFFSFNSEDFLERRRKGLQAFLDKVVHTTVCLSDSQLHLFLQTQLPVGMIQDCVQGHTPYSVTDAILTYASSNWGFAQAQTQEDDAIKEPILTVSYESMESPAPHQPCLQPKDTFTPELLSCGDSDSVDIDAADDGDESQREDRPRSSVRVSQKNNRLEAVVECDCAPTEVAFFLGDDRDDGERLNSTGCRIQTPVEVHSPMEALFEEERSVTTLETEGKTQTDTLGETNVDESEKRVNSVQILDVKGSEEVVCSEVNGLDHVDVSDEKDPEIQVNPLVILDFKKSDSDDQVVENKPRFQIDQNHVVSEVNGVDDETTLQSEIRLETEEEEGGDVVQQMDQNRIKQDDDDVISRSLASSNESIVKVSDEENEDSIQIREDDDDDRNILDLQVNGCSVGKHDEDPRFISPLDLNLNLDLNSAADGADLSGSGDFSVLESSSSVSVVNDVKRSDQETLPPPSSLDGADETRQVLTVNKTVN